MWLAQQDCLAMSTANNMSLSLSICVTLTQMSIQNTRRNTQWTLLKFTYLVVGSQSYVLAVRFRCLKTTKPQKIDDICLLVLRHLYNVRHLGFVVNEQTLAHWRVLTQTGEFRPWYKIWHATFYENLFLRSWSKASTNLVGKIYVLWSSRSRWFSKTNPT